MHAVHQLGTGCVDAAGNVHAVEFVVRARIENHQLAPGGNQLLYFGRRHARRVVVVFNKFAKCLGRHVDAGEQFTAARLPCSATTVEEGDIGVAERGQFGSSARSKPAAAFVTAIKQHQRRSQARHQIARHEFDARQRQRTREERMPLVMHALLTHIKQCQLSTREQHLAHRLRRDVSRDGRHHGARHADTDADAARASRMSVCGGKIAQDFSAAL